MKLNQGDNHFTIKVFELTNINTGQTQIMPEFNYGNLFFLLVSKVRSNLSTNDRKKFNTILIIEVHARDIIDTFVRDR